MGPGSSSFASMSGGMTSSVSASSSGKSPLAPLSFFLSARWQNDSMVEAVALGSTCAAHAKSLEVIFRMRFKSSTARQSSSGDLLTWSPGSQAACNIVSTLIFSSRVALRAKATVTTEWQQLAKDNTNRCNQQCQKNGNHLWHECGDRFQQHSH